MSKARIRDLCKMILEAKRSGPALHLFEPPAKADKKKTPVLKKLRWFAFEIMTDKLQDPANDEQPERDPPHTADKKRYRYQQYGKGDHWNAKAMT